MYQPQVITYPKSSSIMLPSSPKSDPTSKRSTVYSAMNSPVLHSPARPTRRSDNRSNMTAGTQDHATQTATSRLTGTDGGTWLLARFVRVTLQDLRASASLANSAAQLEAEETEIVPDPVDAEAEVEVQAQAPAPEEDYRGEGERVEGRRARSDPIPIPGAAQMVNLYEGAEDDNREVCIADAFNVDYLGNYWCQGVWYTPSGSIVPGKPDEVRYADRRRRAMMARFM